MKKSIILGLLSASMLASVANAEDKKYYTQFNLGASVANNTKYSGTITDGVNSKGFSLEGSPGIAPLFGAEIGTKLNDSFRVGLSLDYREYSNEADKYGVNASQEWSSETKSLATMLNGYYDFTKGDGFNPYVTVGLGIANNENTAKNGTDNSIRFISKENTGFAYKIGLGTKYQINSSFDIDLRYQFVDLGKIEFGDLTDGSDTLKNTTTKSANLRANEILVGIAYKF